MNARTEGSLQGQLKGWDIFRKFRRDRTVAWGSAVVIVLIGLGLIALKHFYLEHATWPLHNEVGELSHELGMGCVVAAVAGVALDWIAFGTERFAAELRFNDRMEALQQATNELVQQRLELEKQQNPFLLIKTGLNQLFEDKDFDGLNDAIVELVRKVDGFKKEANKSLLGEYKLYPFIEFIRDLVDRFPDQAADRLTVLMKDSISEQDSHSFDVPGRYELTRKLLAAQLSSMAPEDELCSIANVMLYRDNLRLDEPYIKATKEAVENHVHIRRIFNLRGLSSEADLQTAKDVIRYQIENFGHSDFFEWRFLTDKVQPDNNIDRDLQFVSGERVPNLEKIFYAVFIHEKRNYLFYRTKDFGDTRSLNMMSIAQNDRTRAVKLFYSLWDKCDVTNPLDDIPEEPTKASG